MKIWPEFKMSQATGPWWKFKGQTGDFMVAGLGGIFLFIILSLIFPSTFDPFTEKTGSSVWVFGSFFLGVIFYLVARRLRRSRDSHNNNNAANR